MINFFEEFAFYRKGALSFETANQLEAWKVETFLRIENEIKKREIDELERAKEGKPPTSFNIG